MDGGRDRGQAAAEFVLSAPLLFLLFFFILQAFYTLFVSLAVQRAALAVAQQASLDPREDPKAFQAQMILNLLPLARLNRQTLWSLLEARYRVQRSGDGKEFLAEVLYPMPIWIPMLRKVLGRPLVPSFPQGSPLQGLDLERLLGPLPAAPLPPPQVRWVRFTGRVFNEGYRSQDHAPLLP